MRVRPHRPPLEPIQKTFYGEVEDTLARHAAISRARRRRGVRLQRRIALTLLAGLFASGGVLALVGGTSPSAYGVAARFDTSKAVTVDTLTAPASRGSTRADVEAGSWSLGESIDGSKLTGIQADNPVVQDLLNGRDRDRSPDGFDPNHATGDTGNAYEFSQCTWWAYLRRHQLGLPVGSHLGNGADWARSARALGYWVDSTPRVGDVMVFKPGQDGNSVVYGHVAIVEQVNADGSVDTSECGSAFNGKPFTRHYSKGSAAQHEYVHY